MTSILVWILVVTTHINSGEVMSYSPPVIKLEDCQRLQQNLSTNYLVRSTCVQVNIPWENKK